MVAAGRPAGAGGSAHRPEHAGPGGGRPRRGQGASWPERRRAASAAPTSCSSRRRSPSRSTRRPCSTFANAKAEVVRAQVAVENARIALEDTDVRAPITGTIIAKNVERGQVISSPTSDVGGGTVLLKMADLNLVQVRTLVDETDIGKIQAGLRATVTVDAYPNRPFEGAVLKIEPQAETAAERHHVPGAGADREPARAAQAGHERRSGDPRRAGATSVLAVPNAALRTQRDVASAPPGAGHCPPPTCSSSWRRPTARGSPPTRGRRRRSSRRRRRRSRPPGNTMTAAGRPDDHPAAGGHRRRRCAPSSQAVLRRRADHAGRAGAAAAGRPAAWAAARRRGRRRRRAGSGSDFQFGGSYIVFVQRDGKPIAGLRSGPASPTSTTARS